MEDFDPRNSSHGSLTTDYECVGWYRTGYHSAHGTRDRNCSERIVGGDAGFCVFHHKRQNQPRRVLPTYADSLVRRPDTVWFTCNEVPQLLAFGDAALKYNPHIHVTPPPALDKTQPVFSSSPSLERGISMSVHTRVLASAYASIRLMREAKMTLPIELWLRPDETDVNHPILQDLSANYRVFIRQILDPRATQYYTKLYAIFFSAFDNVLFLDADNFPVKDPTFLFRTQEFLTTGAIFWPDFWQPQQSIFNVHARSLLWPILGTPFVDMFEQESGQILINRTKHAKTLAALMHYGFTTPRILDRLALVWGDKDLFRLAWLKTNSSFHFITRHAGSAGVLDTNTSTFCGLSMVQHGPSGDIVFFHRNLDKLRPGTDNKRVWTHIQQFRIGGRNDEYRLQRSTVDGYVGCWAISADHPEVSTMRALSEFPFEDVELRVLQFAEDAGKLTSTPKKTL